VLIDGDEGGGAATADHSTGRVSGERALPDACRSGEQDRTDVLKSVAKPARSILSRQPNRAVRPTNHVTSRSVQVPGSSLEQEAQVSLRLDWHSDMGPFCAEKPTQCGGVYVAPT